MSWRACFQSPCAATSMPSARRRCASAQGEGRRSRKRCARLSAERASDSFGRADNKAMLVTAGSVEHLGVLSKEALADRILDRVRLAVTSK